MHWNSSEEKEGGIELDDSVDGLDSTRGKEKREQEKWTNWSLLRATWSGRGSVVLSCESRLRLSIKKSSLTCLRFSSGPRCRPDRVQLYPDRFDVRDHSDFRATRWLG